MSTVRSTAIRTLLSVLIKSLSTIEERVRMTAEKPPASPTVPQPQRKNVADVIVSRLRDLSEVQTQSFTVQAVVQTEQLRRFKRWCTGKSRLLYVASGEVKAGIDLKALRVESVPGEKHIRLHLPKAQVLSAHLDVDRSYVYDVTRMGLCPGDTTCLQTEAQHLALAEIKKTALEQGILTAASERATRLIRELVSSLGDSSVSIEFV